MRIFLICLFAINPILSLNLFSIQQSLTVLCYQFPIISQLNDTDIQCARLQVNENIAILNSKTNNFDLMNLFITIDQVSITNSPLDITIDFTQSQDLPSSISEIHFSVLVLRSNFTINNQTTIEYSQYEIPIFRWQNSTSNTYDLIDIIRLNPNDVKTDKSLCKWKPNRWDRLFDFNTKNNLSYAYFLRSTSSQLLFTLINTTNTSVVPSPLLNVLYCVPYKLGLTEIVLLACLGAVFLTTFIVLSISHHFKGEDENRTHHFERYYNHRRTTQQIDPRRHSLENIRHRSNASIYTLQES